MRRLHLFLIAILASACGWSSSPTGPSPPPAEAVTFLVLTPTQPPAGDLIGRFEDEPGPPADLAGALSAPGVPTDLAASVNGDIVVLTWTAPTAGDPPTTYLIEAGSSAGASNLANFATNSTATSLTARAPNGTFFVRVRARNAGGTSPPSNEVSFTVGSTPCSKPPGAPTELTATVDTSTVSLRWTAPTLGDLPTSYVLEAGSAPGASNLFNRDVGHTTSLTAAAPNGTYFVRVRAVNSCGASGASNEITFTTPQVRLLLVALNPALGAAIPGALYPQALQARVTDSRGNPIANQRVTWSAGGENGWVFPATSLSDANGVAETRWVAGAAVALAVTAAVTDATGTLTARWSATRNVPAGPPGNNSANLAIVSPTATGYRVNLVPLTEPSNTYYAALNWDGGYTGLQRGGDLFDRQIHFAGWDRNNVQTFVVDPAASRCDRFGGEGTGVKCRFSYPWTVGGTYEFEMRAAVGSATTEVSAWFTDLATSTRIKVATLRQSGGLNLSYFFSFNEDFGSSPSDCLARALRQVIFKQPAALVGGAWQRLRTAVFRHPNPLTTCANVAWSLQEGGVLLSVGGTVVGDPNLPWTIPFP